MRLNIFILEDDQWYSEFLKHHLNLNPDNEVTTFLEGRELQKNLHKMPDIVCLDYGIPDIPGNQLLSQIKSDFPNIEVIIVSGQEDVSTAIDLLKKGAYDYIVKDDDTSNRLWQTVNHIREKKALVSEIDTLRQEVNEKYSFGNIIKGSSSDIKKTFALMDKATKLSLIHI